MFRQVLVVCCSIVDKAQKLQHTEKVENRGAQPSQFISLSTGPGHDCADGHGADRDANVGVRRGLSARSFGV